MKRFWIGSLFGLNLKSALRNLKSAILLRVMRLAPSFLTRIAKHFCYLRVAETLLRSAPFVPAEEFLLLIRLVAFLKPPFLVGTGIAL